MTSARDPGAAREPEPSGRHGSEAGESAEQAGQFADDWMVKYFKVRACAAPAAPGWGCRGGAGPARLPGAPTWRRRAHGSQGRGLHTAGPRSGGQPPAARARPRGALIVV